MSAQWGGGQGYPAHSYTCPYIWVCPPSSSEDLDNRGMRLKFELKKKKKRFLASSTFFHSDYMNNIYMLIAEKIWKFRSKRKNINTPWANLLYHGHASKCFYYVYIST